ncbi:unnamed protein product [Pylaiella littoralis]
MVTLHRYSLIGPASKRARRSYSHHLQASTTVVQPTVGTDCRHARNASVVSLA